MSPDLIQIDSTIEELFKAATPQHSTHAGICYLLHHIRDDIFVPIQVSNRHALNESEYYLAFSRLTNKDLASSKVEEITVAVPELLKRGRVESLCFRGTKAKSFWQELIPLSANSRLVLVRSACFAFDAISPFSRGFAFPGYKLAHAMWEKAGAAFLKSQNLETGADTSDEIADHLARHLADEEELPPFFDLVNFHLEIKGAHDLTPVIKTRCNPLGFTCGVVVDFNPLVWEWIPEMIAKYQATGNHYWQHIPKDHPTALSGIEDDLYRSIVQKTHDLVCKVGEFKGNGEEWWFFVRHNRKCDGSDTAFVRSIPPTVTCECPFLSVALAIERKTIQEDHLATLWALNPKDPSRSAHPVGCRVEKACFPELLPELAVPESGNGSKNTVAAAQSSPDEYVRVIFHPRTGCSESDIEALRVSLQEICDATLERVKELAPMARIKARIARVLELKNAKGEPLWPSLFHSIHKATEYRNTADELAWNKLSRAVLDALQQFAPDLPTKWECFSNVDPLCRGLYLNAAKSFQHKALSPELCILFAGGEFTLLPKDEQATEKRGMPAGGYLSLTNPINYENKEKTICVGAGLMLLAKEGFRLADVEWLTKSRDGGMRPYPLLKLRFESTRAGQDGKPENPFTTEFFRRWSPMCFEELPETTLGKGKKENELRTALQLIRPFVDGFSVGFCAKRSKLTPTINLEFECVETP